MDGRSTVMLHDQRGDAVMPEEHRRGQSNQAAADDEDRNVDLGHTLFTIGPP